MKNVSSFNFLFKCEFGLFIFFAFACIIALVNSSLHPPLIVLAFSFDFTKMASPQRNYSEPSLSQCRRLAETITSPRQLVESKGAIQSIHTRSSGNPHIRFK